MPFLRLYYGQYIKYIAFPEYLITFNIHMLPNPDANIIVTAESYS